jgi:hypothetical protein
VSTLGKKSAPPCTLVLRSNSAAWTLSERFQHNMPMTKRQALRSVTDQNFEKFQTRTIQSVESAYTSECLVRDQMVICTMRLQKIMTLRSLWSGGANQDLIWPLLMKGKGSTAGHELHNRPVFSFDYQTCCECVHIYVYAPQ